MTSAIRELIAGLPNIDVDAWMQGRAFPIRKRTCNIHIHIADPQLAPAGGSQPGKENS